MVRRRGLVLAATGSVLVGLARPALAQGRPIRVYHAFPEGMGAIAEAFQAAGGGRVEAVAVGAGDIAYRIIAERRQPQADAVMAVAPEIIELNSAAFAAHEPAGFGAVLPELKEGGVWSPFSLVIPTVLAVNTNLVPEGAMPRGWADLADPAWRGRIAYAGIERSGSALQQMLQIVHSLGDGPGLDVFAGILANSVVTGSSGAVYRQAAQGEVAIGITLEDFAQVAIAGGAPLRIVYPSEGVMLAPSAMAVVADAPNPGGAKALIDFVSGVEAQRILVQRFLRRPVRTDMADPPGLPPIASLPVKTPPIEWWLPRLPSLTARYTALRRG
jgi:iron(III) transport system substrate-binding protein